MSGPRTITRPRAAGARLCAVLGIASLVGCAETPPPHAALHYADEAHARYDRAMALYNDENWQEAGDLFRAIRRDYGLSHWGWLADLRLADMDFKQQHYSEALSGFRSWIRYHPTQPEAPYAHFMIARCYYAQIPDDWFLVPSSSERDQSSVHDAASALQRFVTDHPHAAEVVEATRLLRRVRETLARHELYVAGFYASRQRYPAAISRLLGVLENFDDSGMEPVALMQLGEIYLRTGHPPEARGAFSQVIDVYPHSEQVTAARRFLTLVGPGPVTPVGENVAREPPPPEPPPAHETPTAGGSS